eukprot:14753075-Alexandrium_andersonii.AAC.1
MGSEVVGSRIRQLASSSGRSGIREVVGNQRATTRNTSRGGGFLTFGRVCPLCQDLRKNCNVAK